MRKVLGRTPCPYEHLMEKAGTDLCYAMLLLCYAIARRTRTTRARSTMRTSSRRRAYILGTRHPPAYTISGRHSAAWRPREHLPNMSGAGALAPDAPVLWQKRRRDRCAANSCSMLVRCLCGGGGGCPAPLTAANIAGMCVLLSAFLIWA